MNFRRAARGDEPEINLIPLIDLLLVILIFLMVTTTYAKHGALAVNLPGASADARQHADELVVSVTREGHYAVGQTASAARAPSALAADLAAAARGRKEPLVVIHADAAASHQSVVAVLEAARSVGLARVTFSTQKAR